MRSVTAGLLVCCLTAAPSLRTQDAEGTQGSDAEDFFYDAGAPKDTETPNETYFTVAVALLASSFAFKGCLGKETKKIPTITFVSGASMFLFREVTIKEDFERKSQTLFKVKKWEEKEGADKQITAFEQAAEQQRLAADAAKKKASNAAWLEKTLYASGGLFAFFALKHCASCPIPGLQAVCIPSYNSCNETNACPSVASNKPVRIDMGFADALSFLTSLVAPAAYGSVNLKKLGIVAAASIAGISESLGGKIAGIPDIWKASIMAGLAPIAAKSKRTWERAAQSFEENARKYEGLAAATKQRLESGIVVSAEKQKITAPKYPSALQNIKSRDRTKSSRQPSACAKGETGQMVIDAECGCKKTNSCKSADLPKVDFKALDIPPFVGEAYDSLAKRGHALYNGDGTGIDGQIAHAGGNVGAAQIKKWHGSLLDAAKKGFGDTKGANFDGLKKRALSNFKGAVFRTYRNMSPRKRANFIASTGGGFGLVNEAANFGTTGPLDTPNRSDGVTLSVAPALKGAAAPSSSGIFLDASPSSTGAQDSDGRFEETGDFDIVTDEIFDTDPEGTSLWRIITIRYFKTAFPVIFKRKQHL